jgi:PAS domain S-box-containing protein
MSSVGFSDKRSGELKQEIERLNRLLEERQKELDSLAKLTRRIADNAPDMIWAKDMDNRYLFANRALCDRLLMCSHPEAAIGKKDIYFAQCERDKGQRHTFGEICIDSDEVVKAEQRAMRFVEDGLVRGQVLILDVHKAPLLDESGRMIGTVGCGRDITREREIQKDLEKGRASQHFLMETASDFVVFRLQIRPLRPRGVKVVYLSPSARDIAGITQPHQVNQWFRVHPDDIKSVRYAFVRGFSGFKFNHQFRVWRADQSRWCWLHIIATAVDQNEGRFANGIMFDITEQVESNEALAAKGRELENRTDSLSEVNTALKVLLKKRDEDRKILEEKVLYNAKALIRP